ncbi:hypothetical protein E9549_17675, partial [Blastococcus sp. MG754426]
PTPGGTDPGTAPAPSPATPAPAPSPGGTAPGGPGEGTTTPTPGTPGTTAPGGTEPDTAPSPSRTTTYPEVGAFRITSLSPNLVDSAGGTLVTITGLSLPSTPTVRIGSSATATVVHSSATSLSVRVPARAAGTYDVSVLARDGRSTVLAGALTYADATADDPSGSTPGGTAPAPGTPAPGTPAPGTPSNPAPGTPGVGTGPDAAPAVRTGPHGERLVRSDRFAALGGIWSVGCASSCTGVAL